jgi:hypothetical protein
MKNIKFVVKVNRGGAHAPQYVLRVDRLPIQSMQNSHCNPELVSVRVSA